jgi:ADP-heptose:LPS heptosyltransferase
MTSAPAPVLVLRALGLGDLLTATPALRGLRSAYPSRPIVLAAPGELAELARLSGAVDRVLPTAKLAPVTWPGPPPQVAVNLHGCGPQSHRLLLATRPKTLMAYRHPEVPGLPGPDWDPADPTAFGLAPPPPPSPGLAGTVVVHPGAKHGSRRWPAERFAAVARALARGGGQVVITGSAQERELAQRVAAAGGLPSDQVLAGGLSTLGLAGLVAHASLLVSGDTGIAHLATAFGTPSVVLFGPATPARWGPPPDRPCHVALWHGRGVGDLFAPAPDPALLAITVDEVLAAAGQVLRRPARRSASVRTWG